MKPQPIIEKSVAPQDIIVGVVFYYMPFITKIQKPLQHETKI